MNTLPEWKITAHALGELPEEEAREVENYLQSHPEAHEIFREAKVAAHQLERALELEPSLALTPEQRENVLAEVAAENEPEAPQPAAPPAKTIRFSRWWRSAQFLGWSAAAASVAVLSVVVIQDQIQPERHALSGIANFSEREKPDSVSLQLEGPDNLAIAPEVNVGITRSFYSAGEKDEVGADARGIDLGMPDAAPGKTLGGASSSDDEDIAALKKELKETEMKLAESSDSSQVTFEKFQMVPTEKGIQYRGYLRSGFGVNGKGSQDYTDHAAATPARSSSDRVILGVAQEQGAGMHFMSKNAPGLAPRQHPAPALPTAEAYAAIPKRSFSWVEKEPLSTFSIDVDTAAYANVRRFLTQNHTLPPVNAVRIEELLNYFSYDLPQPEGEHPVAIDLEVGACPWEADHQLVKVALQGVEVERTERPPVNLVLLVDVSGSMSAHNKIRLAQQSFAYLVEQLDARDTISIVTYAGHSGVALQPTAGSQQDTIHDILRRLQSGGSTHGSEGITTAYALARENFDPEKVNRVILATDGDFNVGVTNRSELVSLVKREAQSGVFLTVLGFGSGNLKDATLEQITNDGNGVFNYIDSFREAEKVFGKQLLGTLVTIAKDVKIQVEFNPSQIQAYRLVGYENRALAAEDFNNDKVDAGEMGAGHQVTALYEVVPVGVEGPAPQIDPLKCQKVESDPESEKKVMESPEWLTVKVRYKQPDATKSVRLEKVLNPNVIKTRVDELSPNFALATSVAGFGKILRGSWEGSAENWNTVYQNAVVASSQDAEGYRREYLELVRRAADLQGHRIDSEG